MCFTILKIQPVQLQVFLEEELADKILVYKGTGSI